MTTLSEILLAPQHRDAIIADCVRRVEASVSRAPGLKGLTLKASLAAIKAARPDAVTRAVTRLLPEFAAALEPFYQQFRVSGEKDFAAFLKARSAQVNQALMAVSDERAAASSHPAFRATYQKLRGTLATELASLLPGLVNSLSARLSR